MGTIEIDTRVAAGLTIRNKFNRSANTFIQQDISLPVGTAGTLKVRTADDDGQLELITSAHGIADDDTVDVFWTGGVRYGMNLDSGEGTDTVDVSGGSGDAFPAAMTDIVVTKVVDTNLALDGDNAQFVFVSLEDSAGGSDAGHADFQDSGDSTIAQLDLVANVPQQYDLASGISNPFTGNPVTHVVAANGSASNAATLKVIALVEN